MDPEVASTIEDTPYPYYVFFILGNEFCERYAYYGMRSILVIYLTYFLGYDKDTSTVIYHTFAALCYFFPLIGGILADSYWGKFHTILWLSIVYCIGMALMALSAVPQLNAGLDVPGTINEVLALVALLVVAIGTGGIKPCVSALGGDQFKDTEKGKEQLSGFFSLFYASINAGSLLSTFISPLLRETQCMGRADCYFIAFIVPSALMVVAVIAFVLGKSYYIVKKPSGNVFAEFIKATWNGMRNSCKSKESKEHFLDHADTSRFSKKRIEEFKFLYPLIVMYLPLPFFWALFDMQGSRFVLTATQMDGWMGTSFKMKPDLMQIFNPIMILMFLPIFQYGIYPLLEKCGLKMTSLRRMSAGQVITALAFVLAGFVQMAIDDDLTPIPTYGDQNSMMVINGNFRQAMNVESQYWEDIEANENKTTQFDLGSASSDAWRTPTFDWLRESLPTDDTKLVVDDETMDLSDYGIEKHQISSLLCYTKPADSESKFCEKYISPQEKSGSIRVRAVFLNPTGYYANFRLAEMDSPPDPSIMTNDTIVNPHKNSISDNTEFERGAYVIHARLWKTDPTNENGDFDESIQPDVSCQSPLVIKEGETDTANPDNFMFTAGSIWTLMVTANDKECDVHYDKDSNGNTVNIFLLLPQYIVITIGEVMNSVTGLEFSYTQSPKSLKSVVQSFWLLTVCVGNIIDVFFVEIKLHPTQSGEYFILALIMLGASGIFALLSIFYYDYVPEGQFDEDDKADNGSEADEVELSKEKEALGVENVALEAEEATL